MVQFKYKNRKSQVTPEIMFGVGTIMFLFLLIAVFTLNYQIKLGEQEDYIEKRSECLKMTNLINSVYVSGPGTEVQTHTDFVITAFNGSIISVGGGVATSVGEEPIIAFLASEAGPTTREFYEQVNAQLDPDPDWYRVCFSDLGDPGCSSGVSGWMLTLIPNTIDDLMNNLDNYNTIYLEDSHISYQTDYIDRLSEWVSAGNALIISEHVMCRKGGATYASDSYRCNVDGTSNDQWNIFNVKLYQKDNAWGWSNHRTNVIVNDTDESIDLSIGDTLSFEERSYITNTNASGFKTIAKYINHHNLLDSINKPAVMYWDYGQGKIFYSADFNVNFIGVSEREYSNVLTNLISNAYYLIVRPEEGNEVTCHFSAFAPYGQVTGDIKIRNEDNYIILENVNQTQ
ncbi:hypothetical protein J4438_01895 [Candidatus Woesearchaeota archaeon]|nr:hypothetical protein [Candidatus Woesearchaeota archaeon]